MNDQELVVLIHQYLTNTITDEDLLILRSELSKKSEGDLLAIWDNISELPIDPLLQIPNADDTFGKIIIDDRILEDISQNRQINPRVKIWRTSLKVLSAAMVILLLKFGIDYLNRTESLKIVEEDKMAREIPVPGGNKARIVLTDGTEIDLEKLKSDTLIQLAGYSILKKKDGSIVYAVDQKSPNTMVYNTIVTPKGGEYQLTLSDGTLVSINASSRLRYPVSFAEDFREVELEGEAYFEVNKVQTHHKNIPFIVNTGIQKLEVLGTTFNINSYGESIQTTLVEGSVRLSYNNGESHVIKPNQQLNFSPKDQAIAITDVDPFYALAWKNGAFSFEDASINQVMESIARWYDIEVEYQDDFGESRFSGTMSRSDKLEQVLKTIELTGDLKFKLNGRRVLVMK